MSSFFLQPNGLIIEVKKESQRDSFIKDMSKQYQDFEFASPSSSMLSSITPTIGYIQSILMVFSFIALSISAILFIVINVLLINDNMHEAKLLHIVGIERRDIANSFIITSALLIIISTAIASFSMGILQYVIHRFISSSFKANNPFHLAFSPFVWMISFSSVLLLICLVVLRVVFRFKELNQK